MSVRIIVDSSADVTLGCKDELPVVPMNIAFGTTEYVAGIDIDHKEFYDKLVSSDILPTTSQATPERFMNVFDKIKEAGDSAVVLTLASQFSGTYQSARIAAAEYEDIYVIDSGSATIGIGVLADFALSLAKKGMSAKDIAIEVEKQKEKICIIAMVDTLEYLKKGGRISKTAAVAGSLLNIKPILMVENGVINTIGKVRGIKAASIQLLTEIDKVGGIDFDKPYILGYTGNNEEILSDFYENSRDYWQDFNPENNVAAIGSVIGTHAGPGAIAIAFFRI